LNFSINFKKNLIVINEKTNERLIDSKLNKEKLRLSILNKSLIPNKQTAPKVGIDNKKEILAASTLLNSKNLPAVKVIPDLLTPGINDKAWKKPIKIADL
tara:strand:- start:3 stop:302 length:300 start_codon:yes stop_codon:yes gene_type:complete